MNDANVRALAHAFRWMLDAYYSEDESGVAQYDGPDEFFVAEHFAGQGVLAPAILSNADLRYLTATGRPAPSEDVMRERAIDALERIAKGKPPDREAAALPVPPRETPPHE